MARSYVQRTAHANAQAQRANVKEIKISFVAAAVYSATSFTSPALALTDDVIIIVSSWRPGSPVVVVTNTWGKVLMSSRVDGGCAYIQLLLNICYTSEPLLLLSTREG